MNSSSNDILKYILSNDSENLTISSIAKGTGKAYKNTHDIIKKLAEKNILKIDKIGNSNIVKTIKYPNPNLFSAEYSRREDILKNKNIKNIFNILKRIYFPKIVLLFGSYGKNTFNNHSDIDLMVISEDKHHEVIKRKLNILPLDIHLVFLTFEEFWDLALKKEFSVVSEALKGNIILNGIEDYYILLSNQGV
ncbi:MAG: nucleotidyltransferase domain-containing protein [Methanobrevibacter sp.]|jgi:predicted nucleotidyltransferase|nr:nucleotidyltransferase domain-containing protein [Candidatus Methanovirga aequatorialis]